MKKLIISAIGLLMLATPSINAQKTSSHNDKRPKSYTTEQIDSAQRAAFLDRTKLHKYFDTKQLQKVKNIHMQTFDRLLRNEGLEAVHGKINDPYGEVYDMVNKAAEKNDKSHFFSKFSQPKGTPKDTIQVSYVIEPDGNIGPIYVSKTADRRTKKAIVDALLPLHYDKPAMVADKPVRFLSSFTLITD